MKVKVIKGTNKIGGCVTEISSECTRIIIDLGEDLEDTKDKNPNIDGLTIGQPLYDAVFITHSHGDHIGLIKYILTEIPIYMEEETYTIFNLTNLFTFKERIDKSRITFIKFEEEICINDLKITMYIVDHSAYNSGMILVTNKEKSILHTGDFRTHGRKGKILKPTLDKIIKKVGAIDLLITEGTTLSRKDSDSKKEALLEYDIAKVYDKYDQVFILQSSTNVDRITTMYKANKNHKFILDLFTATITKNIKAKLPKVRTHNLGVYIPLKYQEKKGNFDKYVIKPLKKYIDNNFYDDKFILYVKSSMISDIENIMQNVKNKNACLIYSMYEGYQEKEELKAFLDKIKQLHIKFEFIHTSGHADHKGLKFMAKQTKSKKQLVIHTTEKENAKKVFENPIILEDNDEINV